MKVRQSIGRVHSWVAKKITVPDRTIIIVIELDMNNTYLVIVLRNTVIESRIHNITRSRYADQVNASSGDHNPQ